MPLIGISAKELRTKELEDELLPESAVKVGDHVKFTFMSGVSSDGYIDKILDSRAHVVDTYGGTYWFGLSSLTRVIVIKPETKLKTEPDDKVDSYRRLYTSYLAAKLEHSDLGMMMRDGIQPLEARAFLQAVRLTDAYSFNIERHPELGWKLHVIWPVIRRGLWSDGRKLHLADPLSALSLEGKHTEHKHWSDK